MTHVLTVGQLYDEFCMLATLLNGHAYVQIDFPKFGRLNVKRAFVVDGEASRCQDFEKQISWQLHDHLERLCL